MQGMRPCYLHHPSHVAPILTAQGVFVKGTVRTKEPQACAVDLYDQISQRSRDSRTQCRSHSGLLIACLSAYCCMGLAPCGYTSGLAGPAPTGALVVLVWVLPYWPVVVQLMKQIPTIIFAPSWSRQGN